MKLGGWRVCLLQLTGSGGVLTASMTGKREWEGGGWEGGGMGLTWLLQLTGTGGVITTSRTDRRESSGEGGGAGREWEGQGWEGMRVMTWLLRFKGTGRVRTGTSREWEGGGGDGRCCSSRAQADPLPMLTLCLKSDAMCKVSPRSACCFFCPTLQGRWCERPPPAARA